MVNDAPADLSITKKFAFHFATGISAFPTVQDWTPRACSLLRDEGPPRRDFIRAWLELISAWVDWRIQSKIVNFWSCPDDDDQP
jgi:hypothetical protein